jgi:two-component system, OmpR family, sensor histidine kinase KdpD
MPGQPDARSFLAAQSWTSLAARLSAVVALLAVCTAGLHLLRDDLTTSTIALLYLLPVIVSTTWWGLAAGVLASFAAFLLLNYFFIVPYYTFLVHHSPDLLALAVFLGTSVMVSQWVGRAQANLASAQAREREATQLYELSMALAAQRQEADIARTVAERVQAAVQAGAVEVRLQVSPDGQAWLARLPEAGSPLTGQPLAFPLVTAHGQAGELRLWPVTGGLSAVHQRLVLAMVSQAGLALEQVWLGQAETRTRVLQESDRLKSALLSSVSHELRTPLATIKAVVSSLNSSPDAWQAPEREDLLQMVEEEVDRLNRLVGNLLDMSRIEAGVLQAQRQWNNLGDVVGGTLARMRHATERHRVTMAVPEDLPLVPLDPVQIDQVLTNLVSNSVKYAPPGSTIAITAWAAPDEVRVQVRNQGPPVPEGDLEHIFDKFYRARAADQATGTGLGLSICKGIIEAHGGRIWAENLAPGFAFTFTLPLGWDGPAPPRLPPELEAA